LEENRATQNSIPTSTAYWVDGNDIIIKTSLNWDIFADANNGVGNKTEEIVNRYIWDFIIDDKTRRWLSGFFKRVREDKKPVIIPYRCDTPALKRYMQMTISVESEDILMVKHRVIKTVPMQKPVHFRASISEKSIKRCSVCNRILIDNDWLEPEKSMIGEYVSVRYGVCEQCESLT